MDCLRPIIPSDYTLPSGGKYELTSALQELENLNSEYIVKNSSLESNLASVKCDFSAENEAKENALERLKIDEFESNLEQQLEDEEQREILCLKEENEKLREELISEINKLCNLHETISLLKKKYIDQELRKDSEFNNLCAQLRDAQMRYFKLVESDSMIKIFCLKNDVEYLKGERSNLLELNSALKGKMITLARELKTLKALKRNENDDHIFKSQDVQKKQGSQEESTLKLELVQALKSMESLEERNNSLKKKLHELSIWREKAALFESYLKESEAKVEDLEKKLGVLPTGSVPGFEHMQNTSIPFELAEINKELLDELEKLTSELKSQDVQKKEGSEQESTFKSVLQQALERMESLVLRNSSLQEELDYLEHQLSIWKCRATTFGSHLKNTSKTICEKEDKASKDQLISPTAMLHQLNPMLQNCSPTDNPAAGDTCRKFVSC